MPDADRSEANPFRGGTYAGLAGAIDENAPHLGGSVKGGDPFTFCPSVWDYVIARFSVSSVLDLGSGSGNASQYFFHKGMRVVAIEGLKASVENSLYPAVQHDLTEGPVRTRVDLAHCQEVVEHIEAAYLQNLIDSLLTARIILMTHARPGEGGYHHVNCQAPEYWIENFRQNGCDFLEEDSARVRMLAEKDGAGYMARTGLVFANKQRI